MGKKAEIRIFSCTAWENCFWYCL